MDIALTLVHIVILSFYHCYSYYYFFCTIRFFVSSVKFLPLIKREACIRRNPPGCAWQHDFFSKTIHLECEARMLSGVIDDVLTAGQTLQSSHVT